MTIQFKYPWNGLDGIQTLSSAEEARLVGLGVAREYTPYMDGGPSDTGAVQAAAIAAVNEAVARPGVALAVIGHSISADAKQKTAIDKTWAQWGYLCWLRRYLGSRIYLPFSRVYAVAGKTVAEVLTEQADTAAASGASMCIVDVGINSITTGATFASITTDLAAIYEKLASARVYVIDIGIRVRRTPDALTAPQARLVGRINRWRANYCKTHKGMMYFDPNPTHIDASTGDGKASHYRDGTHDSHQGARAFGKALADRVSPLLPAVDDQAIILGDVYNADNPTGNLLTNGLFAGTAGTLTNGATGQLATGWSAYRVNAASTTTAAFSKEADASITGLEKQVITFGGTGDSVLVQVQQTQVVPGNIAIGDTVQFEMLVEWSSLSAGFQNIGIVASARDGSYVTYQAGKDGVINTPYGVFAAMTDGQMLFQTEPFVVAAGTTVMDTFLTITGPASGSVSGAVKVSRAALRKVV